MTTAVRTFWGELQHKVGERIRGSDFSEDVVMLMGGLSDM